MGNPQIAAIDVVLDQQEAPARLQQRGQTAHQPRLVAVAHKVQRIGHHQAIERRQGQWASEVGRLRPDDHTGEAPRHVGRAAGQRRPVAVNGVEGRPRPQQVGQGQRERAIARAQVGPEGGRIGGWHARTQEGYVVAMVHIVTCGTGFLSCAPSPATAEDTG